MGKHTDINKAHGCNVDYWPLLLSESLSLSHWLVPCLFLQKTEGLFLPHLAATSGPLVWMPPPPEYMDFLWCDGSNTAICNSYFSQLFKIKVAHFIYFCSGCHWRLQQITEKSSSGVFTSGELKIWSSICQHRGEDGDKVMLLQQYRCMNHF